MRIPLGDNFAYGVGSIQGYMEAPSRRGSLCKERENMDFPLLVTEAVKDQSDPNMIVIAITGMIIVFAALLILTLFLMALPEILSVFNEYFPPSEHGHAAAPTPKEAVLDEDLVAAMAIAMIHHHSD